MDNGTEKKPSLWARITAFFGRMRRAILRTFHRIRDRKTHVYRTCPVCKNVLRLPRVMGEHGVNCPACRGHFTVKIKK